MITKEDIATGQNVQSIIAITAGIIEGETTIKPHEISFSLPQTIDWQNSHVSYFYNNKHGRFPIRWLLYDGRDTRILAKNLAQKETKTEKFK